MDRPGASQPLPSSTPTENPVVAVGRKVKAVLTPRQGPSIRILREASSTGEARRRVPVSNDHAPSNQNTSINRLTEARNRVGASMRSLFGRRNNGTDDETHEHEYDLDTVDLLDVNSLFVPSLGGVLNRRPTYRLSPRFREARTIDKLRASLKRISGPTEGEDGIEGEQKFEGPPGPPPLAQARKSNITSTLKQSQYAVLPDGEMLLGWTNEEKEELDDIVRHMLHSRRARFKRAMNGFWQYVRRPLGLFVTVYATLITLFGAAWVLFLIGWISLGSKEDYIVNIVDNVLVALFAIIGDGLAPFRAVDTYHMIYIAHYHRKTYKRRKKLGLPELVDQNDLPEQHKEDVEPTEVDLESLVARRVPRGFARIIAPRIPKRLARRMVTRIKTDDPTYEYSVLTKEQQATLEYHERKFSKSHTFYKPHETETHYAFPFRILVAVVILLDFHSALQISLGACTWGISYKTRPFALTTVILCCSITCNIMGGVLISVGDKRTRKKEVIERMMRQELTSDAILQMETRRMKEAEERGEIDKSVRKRLEDQREEAENEEIKEAWKVVPSLPKVLLGKGKDHREPSLPQKARKSTPIIESTAASSSTPTKPKSRGSAPLPPVQEDPAQMSRPTPALRRGEEPPKEGMGQKALRLVRRADLDRS
ncbi:hypothetical protein B7494_g978 [Chlorociboria aeruginascens]|nr:hypothetical protein B7494_g978 [Chlorociboria aeruginascens]